MLRSWDRASLVRGFAVAALVAYVAAGLLTVGWALIAAVVFALVTLVLLSYRT